MTMKVGTQPPSYNVEYHVNPTQETHSDVATEQPPAIGKSAYDSLSKTTRTMKMGLQPPNYNVEYHVNPTQETIRDIATKHTPAIVRSAYGNLNKVTRFKARQQARTYVVAAEGDAAKYSGKVISREEAERLIEHQRRFIEKSDHLIQIDGYEGLGEHAVPVQWLYTREAANVAGMQQILAFSRLEVESVEQMKRSFHPYFRVVMTPGCDAPGMDGDVSMIVDLENWTTYVIGSDYFGESKGSMLRMLNHYVYLNGGLTMHAACEEIGLNGQRSAVVILGLSGTGKTAITFSAHSSLTKPIQDDMVAIWPKGELSITESGCFAKTWKLTEEREPTIYRGTLHPSAWVENAYLNQDGTFDFSKLALAPEDAEHLREILIETGASNEKLDRYISGDVKYEEVVDENGIPQDGWDFVVWTQNGRSIIPIHAIENEANVTDLPPITSLGMLNRDEGKDAAMPGIVRFTSPLRAAAYFTLGETSKTSAVGKERGRTHVPFTQPFFPLDWGLLSSRFDDLVKDLPGLGTWLMNTGYIGGDQKDREEGKALKVMIRHSCAALDAMLKDEIKWKVDPDFGYEIVDVDAPENAKLLEKVPAEILNPRLFFERNGRLDEYNDWVKRIKAQRKEILKKYDTPQEIQDQL